MKRSGAIPVLVLVAALVLGAAAGRIPDAEQPSTSPASVEHGARLVEGARTLEISGQKDGALADYTKAIESHELDRNAQARAFFDRGLLLDSMNRLDEAARNYGAALSLSPKFAAALNNRANVYRRLGHVAEAERDYRASLAAGNIQAQYSYYGLGEIAEAQGKIDQARDFYGKALAIAPDFVLASRKMAALAAPQPIHLHPPKEVAEQKEVAPEPVILRLPKPKPAPARFRPSEPLPASYQRRDPVLKPALDQGGSGSQVQLGAWRTEAEATQGWDRAVKRAEGILEGYSPHIVAIDLPGAGRYYRLRIATDKSGSKTLCAALQAKGLDCIPAPH